MLLQFWGETAVLRLLPKSRVPTSSRLPRDLAHATSKGDVFGLRRGILDSECRGGNESSLTPPP